MSNEAHRKFIQILLDLPARELTAIMSWNYDYVNNVFMCVESCFNLLAVEQENAEIGGAMVKNMLADFAGQIDVL